MKNTYSISRKICSIILPLIVALAACSEWDEFKKYTKDGEIIYVGKFDSVSVLPGKERVRFWGTLTRDPRVVGCKVYWDNFQDSAEFSIDGPGSDFTFDEIFAVGEGTKSFTVYTFDDAGNRSIGVTVTGNSYGSRYRNIITNRKIKAVAYDDAETTITWDLIDNMLGPVQMEVNYTTIHGNDTVVVTPAAQTSTVLKGLDYENDIFSWHTVFRPQPLAIDTFWSASSTRGVPTFVEKQLDRSLFRAVSLPGDTSPNGGAGGVAAMWDGAAQNSYGGALFTDIGSGSTSPQMATFDLGLNVDLNTLVIYPFLENNGRYFTFSTIRDYEIYGSLNPSSNGDLDGSWMLLNAGSLVKPSGTDQSVPETDADKDAAKAGIPIAIDPAVLKIRYVRIRCLRNYDAFYFGNAKGFFSIAEIRAYGMLPE
jgi:hypothetical protein